MSLYIYSGSFQISVDVFSSNRYARYQRTLVLQISAQFFYIGCKYARILAFSFVKRLSTHLVTLEKLAVKMLKDKSKPQFRIL
jgi:hypothetical protein